MGKHRDGYPRMARDFYPTPRWPVEALLEYVDVAGERVWEPACGQGHIADVLTTAGATVIATDIVNGYAKQDRKLDFLETPPRYTISKIITNPPGGPRNLLAVRFAELGLERLCDGGTLCLLLPNDFHAAKTRRHLFADCEYFYGKVVLTRRIAWFQPESGKRAAPKENYSWFIWRKPNWRSGEPILRYAPTDGAVA